MYVVMYMFSKKVQVSTLASVVYVSLDGENIEIDPQQLYQRLHITCIGTIGLHILFQSERAVLLPII